MNISFCMIFSINFTLGDTLHPREFKILLFSLQDIDVVFFFSSNKTIGIIFFIHI